MAEQLRQSSGLLAALVVGWLAWEVLVQAF